MVIKGCLCQSLPLWWDGLMCCSEPFGPGLWVSMTCRNLMRFMGSLWLCNRGGLSKGRACLWEQLCCIPNCFKTREWSWPNLPKGLWSQSPCIFTDVLKMSSSQQGVPPQNPVLPAYFENCLCPGCLPPQPAVSPAAGVCFQQCRLPFSSPPCYQQIEKAGQEAGEKKLVNKICLNI